MQLESERCSFKKGDVPQLRQSKKISNQGETISGEQCFQKTHTYDSKCKKASPGNSSDMLVEQLKGDNGPHPFHKYETRQAAALRSELTAKQDYLIQRLMAQISFMKIYKSSLVKIDEFLSSEDLKYLSRTSQQPVLDHLRDLDEACFELFEMSQAIIFKCSQIYHCYQSLEAQMGVEKIPFLNSYPSDPKIRSNSVDSKDSTDTDDMKLLGSSKRSLSRAFLLDGAAGALPSEPAGRSSHPPLKKLRFSLALSELDFPLHLAKSETRTRDLIHEKNSMRATAKYSRSLSCAVMKQERLQNLAVKSTSQKADLSDKKYSSEAQTAGTLQLKRSARSSLSEGYILDLDSPNAAEDSAEETPDLEEHSEDQEQLGKPAYLQKNNRLKRRKKYERSPIEESEEWKHLPALGHGTLVSVRWYEEMERLFNDKAPSFWPLMKKARRTGRKACEKSDEIQIVRYLQRQILVLGKLPTANQIRENALTFAKKEDFKASKGWLDKFKSRNLVLLEGWRRRRLDPTFNLLDTKVNYGVLGLAEPPRYLRKVVDEDEELKAISNHRRNRISLGPTVAVVNRGNEPSLRRIHRKEPNTEQSETDSSYSQQV